MKRLVLTLLLAQASISIAQEIDVKASSIEFTVTNLGIDVDGKFRTFSGTVVFDPERPEDSDFDISIPIKSVTTNNKMRDEHLQEEEFFDAENHPNITFKSTNTHKEGNGFVVTGMLTIKGNSRSVSLPFSYENSVLQGTLSINRNDYHVGGTGFLDTIGDDVEIAIKCVLKDED